jgi:hypothetical protein
VKGATGLLSAKANIAVPSPKIGGHGFASLVTTSVGGFESVRLASKTNALEGYSYLSVDAEQSHSRRISEITKQADRGDNMRNLRLFDDTRQVAKWRGAEQSDEIVEMRTKMAVRYVRARKDAV